MIPAEEIIYPYGWFVSLQFSKLCTEDEPVSKAESDGGA